MKRNAFALRSRRVAALLVGITLLAVAAAAIPGVRWRAHLIALGVSGEVPDVELLELIRFMLPSSGQEKLAFLVDSRNAYATIRNPRHSAADESAGQASYLSRCAECHGRDGSGARGPALAGRSLTHGESDWALYRTIRLGIPNTMMQAHPIAEDELWQLVGHIRVLQSRVDRPPAQVPGADLPKVDLRSSALIEAVLPGDEWLAYAGSYNGQRHSTLQQITPANASRLTVRWLHQFAGEPAPIECSPVVHAGRMFVTVPPRVFAIDLRTGKTLWERDLKVHSTRPDEEHGEALNRGPALLGDRLFVGTRDARLVALSATTGEVLWETVVDDRYRYHLSGAPLAVRDMVMVGVGMFGGGRGFIAAYDAATGKQRWRFVTIPGPNEKGSQSWSGESWRDGGGPTWITGSYDAAQDLLIWGVGNPKPDYDTAVRQGDNLYTNSVVALKAATGELAWYFQFTPADDRDWDSNQTPVLADYQSASGIQKRVLWANRNGFYYVLDRTTGAFIAGQPFVTQNWADGLDVNGRPKPRADSAAARGGSVVYPGGIGGTNWWSPTYDAVSDTFFVPFVEQGVVVVPSSNRAPADTPRPLYTGVRALAATTGKLLWEHRHPSRMDTNDTGGLLSTRSGLVFGSDKSELFALDSRTGARLFTFETGAKISAAPITYNVNGQQYLSIISGRDLFAFSVDDPDGENVSTRPRRSADRLRSSSRR